MEKSNFVKFASNYYKEIPIFYIPIHPDDRDKRDCLTWSMIHGAFVADYISRTISKWVTPRSFYVSFPYGIYNVKNIRAHRRRLSLGKRTIFSYDGKTAQEGEFLPFTFYLDDARRFKNTVRKRGTGKYEMDYSGESKHDYNLKLRPIGERFSARFFNLEDVIEFHDVEDEEIYELDWYYNISSWNGLCEYLGSEERKQIRRAPRSLMSYHEFSPVSIDFDE